MESVKIKDHFLDIFNKRLNLYFNITKKSNLYVEINKHGAMLK